MNNDDKIKEAYMEALNSLEVIKRQVSMVCLRTFTYITFKNIIIIIKANP